LSVKGQYAPNVNTLISGAVIGLAFGLVFGLLRRTVMKGRDDRASMAVSVVVVLVVAFALGAKFE
jgi:NhaP-type Na+/H+ or K+/H+ antiporter